jgi:hypothetical protein
MKKHLKLKAIICLIILVTTAGCKKENQAPVISSLVTSKQRIAMGQHILITPSVTDGDTDNAGLKYTWTSTDGLSSNESVAKWTPTKVGQQSITLTVSDGEKSSNQTLVITVEEPDFRRALWGNSGTDILLYESKFGKTAEVNNSTMLSYVDPVFSVIEAYSLTNNMVTAGFTVYTTAYTNNFDRYITDYNTSLNLLKTKHGNFQTSKIYFRTEAIQTQLNGRPELYADAIVAGDARLETVWSKEKTTITHILVKSTTSTTVILATTFNPKTAPTTVVSSTSQFSNSKVQREIEKALDQASK